MSKQNSEKVILRNGDDQYVVLGTLGQGTYGRVLYARTEHGEAVAIKVIHKFKLYRQRKGRDMLLNEQRIMRRLTECGREFLVPLLASWDDSRNVYLVMPMYYESLLDRLRRRPLDADEIDLYIAELVVALNNLHACGVMHRDIKPENIFIDPSGHLAIGDFGLSCTDGLSVDSSSKGDKSEAHKERRGPVAYKLAGTPGYFAPEVLTFARSRGYDCNADVWSMGMVIFEMVLGRSRPLYDALNAKDLARQMMLGTLPWNNIIDIELRDLLSKMLRYNPKGRWTSEQLKSHPFFAGIDWAKLEERGYQPAQLPPFPKYNSHRTSVRFSTFHLEIADSQLEPDHVFAQMLEDTRNEADHKQPFVFRRRTQQAQDILHEDVDGVAPPPYPGTCGVLLLTAG